jgi:hypothetical protein
VFNSGRVTRSMHAGCDAGCEGGSAAGINHVRSPHRRNAERTTMKIAAIKTTPLALAFKEPYHWAGRVDYAAAVVLVEVETDDGLAGVGESVAAFPAEGTVAALQGVAPLFIGQPVFDIERLVTGARHLGSFNYTPWRPHRGPRPYDGPGQAGAVRETWPGRRARPRCGAAGGRAVRARRALSPFLGPVAVRSRSAVAVRPRRASRFEQTYLSGYHHRDHQRETGRRGRRLR